MEWIIFAAIVYVFWQIYSSRKKKEQADLATEFVVEQQMDTPAIKKSSAPITGHPKLINNNEYCINPKSPFPISFSGVTDHQAAELKNALEADSWGHDSGEATFLFAELNIECKQLNDFVKDTKAKVHEDIETRISSSVEWRDAGPKDREAMIEEFQLRAIESLEVHPSDIDSLNTLLFDEPADLTADDELLKIFSGKKKLYQHFAWLLSYGPRVHRVTADDYRRAEWEQLIELKLARRGKDIPLEALLEGLRLKDITEIFADRIEKKLTRKAAAIEFASAQPDALELISNKIALREMFQIVEPTDIDVSEVRNLYNYAASQVRILRATCTTAKNALETIREESEYKSDSDVWVIESEDCCSHCRKSNGKKSKLRPKRLPPFHIGCTCEVSLCGSS